MSEDVAIRVRNVSKTFKLPHEKASSIKSIFLNPFKRRTFENQQVLKNISFDVKKGEFFGIVGRNGSGKSTLLKLISQIYTPDEGSIEVNGKLVPFIELGVGFNPELTGRENVFLNGALLGFSRKEMEEMYDEIVEFAELERFMDQKLKNYSSGMQVRLAFSIAIRAKADILVLDEVLAVGDEAFQRKCNEYFRTIKEDKSKTVILVTHGMDAIRKFADRAMLIKNGEIILDGAPEDVANEYGLENLAVSSVGAGGIDDKAKKSDIIKNFKVKLLSPRLINQTDEIKIKVEYETDGSIETYAVVDVKDIDRGVPLITAGSPKTNKKNISRTWTTKLSTVNNTNLIINLAVRDKNNDVLYFLPEEECPKFAVRRTDYPDPKKPMTYALLFDKGKWSEK